MSIFFFIFLNKFFLNNSINILYVNITYIVRFLSFNIFFNFQKLEDKKVF